ncbi:transmembrane [Cryptosporidium sp. chipmunk genotype I]|uniref:transmembrane n=1 Tax=Cryptosporidium sp. chipmunk genotype I TaxID=1280935 RepID=UPI00351A6729|nr:transmembrane [Cryptosporidium sp. chipmunk genotype I]
MNEKKITPFQEVENNKKKLEVYEKQDLNEKKKELWIILKSLGAITLVSAVMNLILVGIMIFMVNSLIKGIISEYSRQIAIQKGILSNFVERNSRIEKSAHNERMSINDHWKRGAGILPLNMLYNAPLKSLENVDAIILEFDEPEQVESENQEKKIKGKKHQHMYHVESITREVSIEEMEGEKSQKKEEAVLKFNLTNEGTLSVYKEKAILRDRLGNKVHELIFESKNQNYENQSKDAEKLLRSDSKEEESERKGDSQPKHRKLISSNSHKHSASHSLKTQSGYMAAVCKYGCGEMGVTYPYYYRPFFGYGFPLLGTEPYFQSGYGGNVETAMNNNMFNPESASPRPPGVQATPQTSPFAMGENPYSYPYSSSPGGGYYYYYNFYPPPIGPEPLPYYEESYYYTPQNTTEEQ